MPNGKKSASRQLSANESAMDSYKHPAIPAVNRAGRKPCWLPLKVQHYKSHKVRAKPALAALQRMWDIPTCTPRAPQPAPASSSLGGGILRSQTGTCVWAGSALPASQLHSGAAEVPAKVCSARGQ